MEKMVTQVSANRGNVRNLQVEYSSIIIFECNFNLFWRYVHKICIEWGVLSGPPDEYADDDDD